MVMSEAAANNDIEHTSMDSSTHFVFENKVFQVEGCHFVLTPDTKEPVFLIPMGEMMASVKLGPLCQEFSINPGSNDAQLLDLVKKGLPYVRRIRPFDVIPSEVLDGSASWHVGADHEELAKDKLSMKLVTWLLGKSGKRIDKAVLQELTEDSVLKERVNEAFQEASEQLKVPKQQITNRFDDLVKELAYIEALRDYYADIFKIYRDFKPLQEAFSGDSVFTQDVERMRSLMLPPIEEIKTRFEDLDGRTDEILASLGQFDTTVEHIRQVRDDLHLQTHTWDELKELWDGVPIDRTEEAKKASVSTYEFLARNFTMSYTW